MEAVVAKMKCHEVTTSNYGSDRKQHKVQLGAICSSSGENAAFTKATPAGALWMNIEDGMPALDFFEPGKTYYVTFTEAPAQ